MRLLFQTQGHNMPVKTDIVILSYRDDRNITRCLERIYATSTDYNILLVDNNLVNRGWSKGNNYGASLGSAPFIWFLNSDAYPEPECLQALIDRMDDSNCGAVASKQLDPDNPDKIRYGGGLNFYPTGQHRGGLVSLGNCDLPSRQSWLNGASMLVRRWMFNALGGYNESMFMYYGDSDYSLRVRKTGHSLWYEPKSVVLHRLGSSANASGLDHDKKTFEEYWGIVPLETGYQMPQDTKNLFSL
jgi:GT2 family glycosyltransferase